MKTRKTKQQLEQHRQRWIAIRAFYRHLREEAAASLAVAQATYDTGEYHSARWKHQFHYGAAEGALELARELGIVSYSSGYYSLEARARRIRDAARRRAKTISEAKYARIREDQP